MILRQANKFVKHQEEKERIDSAQDRNIEENRQKIERIKVSLDSKDLLDKEQSQRIENLESNLKTFIESKDNLDSMQDEKLQDLETRFLQKDELDNLQNTRLENCEKQIVELQNKLGLGSKPKSNFASILLSSIALITSIASIVCVFVLRA